MNAALEKKVNVTVGSRLLIVAVILAAVSGISMRLILSPERLRIWVEQAIAAQPVRMNLAFDEARLKLADGALPQLAVELSGVRIIAAPDCQNDPSLTIARLRVPFRVSRLLLGQIAFGVIAAEDVNLDIDGFRETCRPKPDSGLPEAVPNAVASAPEPPRADGSRPWWSEPQFDAVEKTIRGVSFTRLRIDFEKRSKAIYLDSFRLRVRASAREFYVQSRVRIPKELSQGETLPEFEVSSTVKADQALVKLGARINEGKISGEAELTPLPEHDLKIDAKLRVASLPLSTAVPLLSRVAVIKREMKPRFLWLNCEAEVSGRFQGLLHKNPLVLKACEVAGNGTKIRVDRAVRQPSGDWDRFTGTIESADMRQMLETFSVSGLEGIATEFGKFDGHLEVENKSSARLIGKIDGMQLRFSNHSERLDQELRNIETEVRLHEDGSLTADIAKMQIVGGDFAGRIDFDFTKSASRGTIRMDLERLKFREEIQDLMIGGRIESIKGHLAADLEGGKLKTLKGRMDVTDLKAEDWTFAQLQVSPTVSKTGGILLQLKSPELQLGETSPFYAGAKSALFGRTSLDGGAIPIKDVQILAEVPFEGGFHWSKASGTIERGRVKLSSEGNFTRDHTLEGQLSVDYPQVKNLRWILGGTVEQPSFVFDESSASERFNESMRKQTVTDQVLGL